MSEDMLIVGMVLSIPFLSLAIGALIRVLLDAGDG
tara:strand:- start:3303 stop:3407 length:105 start_codon:yes stop_codon:yes gene_type:complete